MVWIVIALTVTTVQAETYPPQEWSDKSGLSVKAYLVNFTWEGKVLHLEVEGVERAQMLPAYRLDFRSTVQLLMSPVYYEQYRYHRDELMDRHEYVDKAQELRKFGLLLLGSCLLVANIWTWLFASFILNNGNPFRLMLHGTICGFILSATWFLVNPLIREFGIGDGQGMRIATWIMAGAAILGTTLVLYRANLLQVFFWYLLSALAWVLTPISLTVLGIALHLRNWADGQVTREAFEAWVVQFWLQPMGLL